MGLPGLRCDMTELNEARTALANAIWRMQQAYTAAELARIGVGSIDDARAELEAARVERDAARARCIEARRNLDPSTIAYLSHRGET